MSVKYTTTYECDRCGHSSTDDADRPSFGRVNLTFVAEGGSSYSYMDGNAPRTPAISALWCKTCFQLFNLPFVTMSQQNVKPIGQPTAVSLEALVRQIVSDELKSKGQS